jgi:outer membrane lipoprotein-sorting protein
MEDQMKIVNFLVCALIAAVVPAAASAGESVESIFANMDKITNGYADSMMSVHMTVYDVDGSKKAYDFDIYQKGQQRLMKFTSGEIKGMANLVKSPSEVYAYLPSQKKIRRVASHKMGQSLAGSDMTSDDAAFTSWVDAYTPTLDKEDANYWYISAKARKDAPYPGAKLKIHKGDYQLAEYQFLNEQGGLIKTYISTDLKDWGNGVKRAKFITIQDGQSKHKTTLDLKAFKINQGYKDDMFSKRELEWGR